MFLSNDTKYTSTTTNLMSMSQATQRDFVWKLIVGGQGGVGKTTILYRFVHDQFLDETKLTIGVDFHKQSLERQGYNISLILWDLGGQERFRPIHDAYIRGSHGGFVCFDLSSHSTLESAKEWIEMFRQNVPGLPIVLVGTKYDLIENDPEMIREMIDAANKIVEEHDLIGFFLTSAKSGLNVKETIHFLIDVMLYKMNEPIPCSVLDA